MDKKESAEPGFARAAGGSGRSLRVPAFCGTDQADSGFSRTAKAERVARERHYEALAYRELESNKQLLKIEPWLRYWGWPALILGVLAVFSLRSGAALPATYLYWAGALLPWLLAAWLKLLRRITPETRVAPVSELGGAGYLIAISVLGVGSVMTVAAGPLGHDRVVANLFIAMVMWLPGMVLACRNAPRVPIEFRLVADTIAERLRNKGEP